MKKRIGFVMVGLSIVAVTMAQAPPTPTNVVETQYMLPKRGMDEWRDVYTRYNSEIRSFVK